MYLPAAAALTHGHRAPQHGHGGCLFTGGARLAQPVAYQTPSFLAAFDATFSRGETVATCGVSIIEIGACSEPLPWCTAGTVALFATAFWIASMACLAILSVKSCRSAAGGLVDEIEAGFLGHEHVKQQAENPVGRHRPGTGPIDRRPPGLRSRRLPR